MFRRISYEELNPRQKRNFNFQKVAAKLADYGFNCVRLNDDWQGADFIAYHIDGNTSIRVQLRGRDIYITFNQDGEWYLYPHD
ncbi:hypothetical protein NKDENANG_03610 [Candidatus Entotheonellaceae bacterium PAL068K]